MRRLRILVGAAAVLFALTACGEQQSDVGFGGQPPPPATQESSRGDEPPKPVPEKERTEVPTARVDGSALPEGYPREVWTQNGGSVLVVTGQEGGCGEVRARVTEQTERRVGVELVEETPRDAGPCTMDLRYPPVTAPLDSPLGEREVVLTQRETTVAGE
ncbi:lipoprotein [Actinopolyspora mortivallis]|uniref:LptM family lipoprotein n=1 Tax=Actinopolyspora mortivallis TaxID=33906 RepID=UPI00047AC865|nr:hypothetical protein [Actinopolyspora mortivallis]